MRKSGFFTAAMAILVASTASALAQAGTEGPLAAPDDTPHAVVKPTKKPKHKKVAHHDAARAQESFASDGSTPRRDLALPRSGDPTDPMSFGMKWNGNSDNARETRVQNYNAGASGSGAEVGMKLHF